MSRNFQQENPLEELHCLEVGFVWLDGLMVGWMDE